LLQIDSRRVNRQERSNTPVAACCDDTVFDAYDRSTLVQCTQLHGDDAFEALQEIDQCCCDDVGIEFAHLEAIGVQERGAREGDAIDRVAGRDHERRRHRERSQTRGPDHDRPCLGAVLTQGRFQRGFVDAIAIAAGVRYRESSDTVPAADVDFCNAGKCAHEVDQIALGNNPIEGDHPDWDRAPQIFEPIGRRTTGCRERVAHPLDVRQNFLHQGKRVRGDVAARTRAEAITRDDILGAARQARAMDAVAEGQDGGTVVTVLDGEDAVARAVFEHVFGNTPR